MIQLHYYPSTAAMVPHILFEEIGASYERVLVDRTVAAHKTAGYLRLNPNGLIPVLTDGDLVLCETAAIVLHLCDTNPASRMAPVLATAERAHFYKWLMWLTNTLQASLIVYFYPERWMNDGNAEGAAQLKAHAERKVAGLLDQLDAELARHGQPCSQALSTAPWTRTCSRCAAGRAISGTNNRHEPTRSSVPTCNACWPAPRCNA